MLTETLGGCSRDAQVTLPGMLEGCSGVLTGSLGWCQQAARGCWRAGPALPVRLRAPRSAPRPAPRLAERRGRREAAGRGGGGVSSPTLPQARLH